MPAPRYTASGVGCTSCSALMCSRKMIVDGAGSPNPRIIFIAEAPGEAEDESGIPFVGKSGQLLRSTIAEAGLGLEDIYFTNAIRCHPENNRDPSDEELRNCSGWLVNELLALNAKDVVLLGKVARRAWAMVADDVATQNVYELPHPSWSLRNPKKRNQWKAQLFGIIDKILGREPADGKTVAQRVEGWVEGEPNFNSPWIAADTETKDLENETYGNELVISQVSDGHRAAIYAPVDTPYLEHVYLHNAKYDANALGIQLRDLSRWDDTALMAYVLRDGPVGLKDVGPRLTGIPMRPITDILTTYDYEEKEIKLTKRGLPAGSANVEVLYDGGTTYIKRTRKKRKRNFEEALEESPEEAREYALKDAVVTSRLASILHPRLAAEPKLLRYYRDLEKPVVPILHDAELEGVRVNPDVLLTVRDDLQEQMRFHEENVHLLLEVPDTWKISSDAQLVKELLRIGVPLRNRTKGGAYSVDAASLLDAVGFQKLADLEKDANSFHRQVVLGILRYREAQKLDSTYVSNLLKRMDARGHVHGSFNQMVTDTDRLSSSDPNLQNIPIRTTTGVRIRAAFIADDDHYLVKADFSALELRILTHYIDDPGMRGAFERGDNPHDLNAARWGIERSRAKNFIFGLAYGMEERKAAIIAGIPESQAGAFLRETRQSTPGLLEWPKWIEQWLIEKGYLETLLGFRNYYPGYYSPIRSEVAAALREAGNFPIQGTASGIVKRYMIALDQITKKYDAIQVLQVHDEVVTHLPKNAAHEFAAEADEIARGIATDILSVPLEVEIKIGASWQGGKVWRRAA